MLRKLCKSKFEYIYIHTCMYVKKCCDNDGMLRCTPAGSFNGPKVIGRGSPCVTIGWSWTRHPSALVHCITHPLFWVGLHEHLREKPANPAWGPQGFWRSTVHEREKPCRKLQKVTGIWDQPHGCWFHMSGQPTICFIPWGTSVRSSAEHWFKITWLSPCHVGGSIHELPSGNLT